MYVIFMDLYWNETLDTGLRRPQNFNTINNEQYKDDIIKIITISPVTII